MAPILVVIGLLLLGVAIVAWHTRAIWWHVVAHLLPPPPLTRAARAARVAAGTPAEPAPQPAVAAEPHAFAHAPASRSFMAEAPIVPPASANDPFAHAPAVSELAGPQSGETRH